jgi:hypothetical protein
MASIDRDPIGYVEWSNNRRIRDLEEQLVQLKNSIADLGASSSPRIGEINTPHHANDFIGYAVPSQPPSPSEPDAETAHDIILSRANLVRAKLRQRRMRETLFTADLFADPAWDMLLDLFAAELEGQDVSVSSLCIAASVPTTTALRWIKLLTQRGWLTRSQDPKDGRRINMRLSDDARARLIRYFDDLAR